MALSIAPFSLDDTNVASKLPPMDDPKATNPNARYDRRGERNEI